MRTDTGESYQERINRVLVHIQQRLEEPLPLDELAGVAAFSPYHFHRIFRGMVGESVKEHVRRLRLERAAGRLRASADPITDIAFDANYQTHESFTRAFRAMFGDAPSGFRENRREILARAGEFRVPPFRLAVKAAGVYGPRGGVAGTPRAAGGAHGAAGTDTAGVLPPRGALRRGRDGVAEAVLLGRQERIARAGRRDPGRGARRSRDHPARAAAIRRGHRGQRPRPSDGRGGDRGAAGRRERRRRPPGPLLAAGQTQPP